MKIGIISRGRTRSTAIINSIATNLNLPNKSEIYFQAHDKFIKQFSLLHKLDQNNQLNVFGQKIDQITNSLFENENFICKIWPSMLIMTPHQLSNDLINTVYKNTLFEANKYIRLSEYDQLYFIDRNILLSTLSWVYSKKTRIFHKHKNQDLVYEPIDLTASDYDRAKFYILEYCLQQKLKHYLIENNIPFTDISDTNYKEYTIDSLLLMEEHNVDYESLISNSKELIEFISYTHDECINTTYHWKFI